MSSKDFDPNIILFTIPCAEECGLYITNIIWNESSEMLWNELNTKLSCFGILYNIYVAPSKFKNKKNQDTFYALAKFYSKNAAETALANSGKLHIDGNPIKISRMLHDGHKVKYMKLNSHSMEELISYYFGFNYWSSRVVQLKKAPSDNDVIRFICVVNVTTKDNLLSEGIGLGEVPFNADNSSNKLAAYKLARKFAVGNAKSDALSKFVIIELPNGKRMMDVNYQRPDPFYIETKNDELDCQIKNLQSDPEEEDSDCSLTMDESLNESQWIENLPHSLLDKLLDGP